MKQLEKQKLLLRSIFKACGGPTELGKHLQIPRQRFTNWQIRGKVPVVQAVEISKKLEISKWGLNFPDFCAIEDKPLTWKEVVKSYIFLSRRITDILLEENVSCLKKTKKKKKKML